MGEGVVEQWAGSVPDYLDADDLCHLPPPFHDGFAGERVVLWEAAFRPGLCYYRAGPGFLEVRDVRRPADAARLTIDDHLLISVFTACLSPTAVVDLDASSLAAAETLLAERLLLRFDGVLLTAPYRMRRWPVPARLA